MKAKRKLSDLKGNEYIKINSFKEAKKIKKLAGVNFEIREGYFAKYFWTSHEPEKGASVYPAFDFIKPKKSKIKKLSKKVDYLMDFVSNMQPKGLDLEGLMKLAESTFEDLKELSEDNFNKDLQKLEEIKTFSDEIDWSKPGQLVWDEIEGTIILTSWQNGGNRFSGMVVTGRAWETGEFSKGWDRSSFKLYTLPLTLKNE